MTLAGEKGLRLPPGAFHVSEATSWRLLGRQASGLPGGEALDCRNRDQPASAKADSGDFTPVDGCLEGFSVYAEPTCGLADRQRLRRARQGRGHASSTARPLRRHQRRIVERYPDQTLLADIDLHR